SSCLLATFARWRGCHARRSPNGQEVDRRAERYESGPFPEQAIRRAGNRTSRAEVATRRVLGANLGQPSCSRNHPWRCRMQIRVGYELRYSFPRPTAMILSLNVHHSRVADLVFPDHMLT